MSRGFYSKHFVSQDRCFFFNPETGLSSWSPPVDGIVLEAPNARKNLVGAAGSSETPSAAAPIEASVAPRGEPAESEAAEDQQKAVPEETVPREASKSSAGPSTVDEFLSSAWEQVNKKRGS